MIRQPCLLRSRLRRIALGLSSLLLLGLLSAGAYLPVLAQSNTPPDQNIFNANVWTDFLKQLGTFENPVNPQVVVAPSGTVHLIWEDGGKLYHAWRTREGGWQGPRFVYLGVTPSLALDSYERLHMVFAQKVQDNFEIYHVVFDGQRWSLPRNVSHTSGNSYSPSLTVAPDGTLHVVWNDKTPGKDVIYHATLESNIWVDYPLTSAWGKAPTLYVTTSRIFHLLWQGNSLQGKSDVFHLQGQSSIWQLPENISDSQGAHSVGVQGVLDPQNRLHVVWNEQQPEGYQVYYTFGYGDGWLLPQPLSPVGASDASVGLSEYGNYIHVWWSDARGWWSRWRAAASLRWSSPIQFAYAGNQVIRIRFATENDTRLRALWRVDTDQGAELWYREARTPVTQRLYFAHLGNSAPFIPDTPK